MQPVLSRRPAFLSKAAFEMYTALGTISPTLTYCASQTECRPSHVILSNYLVCISFCLIRNSRSGFSNQFDTIVLGIRLLTVRLMIFKKQALGIVSSYGHFPYRSALLVWLGPLAKKNIFHISSWGLFFDTKFNNVAFQ